MSERRRRSGLRQLRDGRLRRARSRTRRAPRRDSPVALRIAGESRAGRPATVPLSAGEAIRISTGAVVPDGADAVVRIEDCRELDGTVEMLQSRSRRARSCGAPARTSGPATSCSSAGRVHRRRPRWACSRRSELRPGRLRRGDRASTVLSTGDELVEPGEPLRAGPDPQLERLHGSGAGRSAPGREIANGRDGAR